MNFSKPSLTKKPKNMSEPLMNADKMMGLILLSGMPSWQSFHHPEVSGLVAVTHYSDELKKFCLQFKISC